MALIEEVWGDLSPSTTEHTNTKKEEPEITQDVKETFVQKLIEESPMTISTPAPTQPNKKGKGLPLFLALLVTGGCAIYALDMFTSTIAGSGRRIR